MFLVAKVNFFLQTTRSAIVFYGRGESYEEVLGERLKHSGGSRRDSETSRRRRLKTFQPFPPALGFCHPKEEAETKGATHSIKHNEVINAVHIICLLKVYTRLLQIKQLTNYS